MGEREEEAAAGVELPVFPISYQNVCITRHQQFRDESYFTDARETLYRPRVKLTEGFLGKGKLNPFKAEKYIFFDVYYKKSRGEKPYCWVGQKILFLPRFVIKDPSRQPGPFVGRVQEVLNTGEIMFYEKDNPNLDMKRAKSVNSDLILIEPLSGFNPGISLAAKKQTHARFYAHQ